MSLAVAPAGTAAADACLRGVIGALCPGGRPLMPVQHDTLHAVMTELWGYDIDPTGLPPLSAAELAERVTDPDARRRLVQLMVTLELLLHPLPREVADQVRSYALALGVREPTVRAARLMAHDQAALMYMCLQRNSWYPAETRRGIRNGRLFELLGSKLAYYAAGRDERIAARWRALGDLPADTWGRGVHEFYVTNGFPFPGERHGIYEVGAKHDWVHVLTDYGTTAEGEIDVFAFIAAAMPDPQGFVLLVVALGIFQNGTVRHMFGRRLPMGGVGAMETQGAPQRFADAVRRGSLCGVDVLGGVDHFALADQSLDAVRERFNVVPPRS